MTRRRNPLWVAAMVHRLSGIGLAAFLPFHFLTLGLSLQGADRLDGFLRWTDAPLVRLSEAGLVFLLAVHLLGGLRVLAMEAHGMRGSQLRQAALAGGAAAVVAGWFLVRVF